MDAEALRRLVQDGASVARMSAELGVSRYAVKRALAGEGLRTARSRTLEEARRARVAGDRAIQRRCPRHGVGGFAVDARGTYRCIRCSSDAVSRRRRRVKEILVREAGGACAVCGYDRCIGALAFHHRDPALKRFGLAQGGLSRSLAAARAEVAKCVLLCANCHAEIEAGMISLGDPVDAAQVA